MGRNGDSRHTAGTPALQAVASVCYFSVRTPLCYLALIWRSCFSRPGRWIRRVPLRPAGIIPQLSFPQFVLPAFCDNRHCVVCLTNLAAIPPTGFLRSFQTHSKTTANPHIQRTLSDEAAKKYMVIPPSICDAKPKQAIATRMPPAHILIFERRMLVLRIRRLNSIMPRSRRTLDRAYAISKK
jgi:hypothetical protein